MQNTFERWLCKSLSKNGFARHFFPQNDFVYCFASALHGGVFDMKAFANPSRSFLHCKAVFESALQVWVFGKKALANLSLSFLSCKAIF